MRPTPVLRSPPRTLLWRLAFGAFALVPAVGADVVSPTRLDFLGEAALPSGLRLEGAPVGGLSGLLFDPARGLYLAVSDDPAERGPARLYLLEVDLGDGRLEEGNVRVRSTLPLLDAAGRPFARDTVDLEGIAPGPDGSFYLSSEGVAASGAPPFVARFSADGRLLEELPVPEAFLPDAAAVRGVRPNLGFESLTATPDGARLVAAAEGALLQDGAPATPATRGPCRLVVFPLDDPRRTPRQHAYWTEPVHAEPETSGGLAVNGLVELLALDRENLLSLERSFVAGRGFKIRLFHVYLGRASDVRRAESLAATPHVPGVKELLVDFDDLGLPLDNVEGMTFGPPLPDGRRTLVLVADDNFNPLQRTQFLAFAVSAEPLRIRDVQGRDHRSPLEGSWVGRLEGVVTALDRGGNGGFWLQDGEEDGDPATSEGIFVAAHPLPPGIEVGDRARVRGRVVEQARPGHLPVTRLREIATVLLAEGQELPAAVVVGEGGRVPPPGVEDDGLTSFDPGQDTLDFYESLEGMRVSVPESVVVGPTSEYGELVVLPDGGRRAALRSPRGGVVLGPGGADPERLILSHRLLGDAPLLRVGDRLEGTVTGVLDYAFGAYRLAASEPLPAAVPGSSAEETTALVPAPGKLTVATFNVLNLDAADPDEKFSRLAATIVRDLGGPDVLALQEVQDDDGSTDSGATSAAATLGRLAAAVREAGGPAYAWRQIDPEDAADGGEPGGNIRVAFLFNPARVRFVDRGAAGPLDATAVEAGPGGPLLTLSPGRIAPSHPAFAGSAEDAEGSRKPLAAEVEFEGKRLFLVNLHLDSKRGDDRLFGATQPPVAHSEARRTEQARAVRDFVREIYALDPEARVVVLGDLNEHAGRPPLAELAAAPLVNLTERVPETDRYSFNFEGTSQLLDHILVSPSLAAAAPEIDIAHVHADLPDAERGSDHDPIVARLQP